MELAIAVGLLIIGFVVLIKGADFLVDGASAIAKRFNISDIIIGLTIVSFGTSAPELVVNIGAAMEGNHAMIFGNVLGSNIFNTCLILGTAGLIYPLVVQRDTVRLELPFSILIVGFMYVLANDVLVMGSATNTFSTLDGGLLLLVFGGFLLYIYKSATASLPAQSDVASPNTSTILDDNFSENVAAGVETDIPEPTGSILKDLAFVVLGMVGLIFGGDLVLENAKFLANQFGMSDRVIGLTVVAIGTSLPELATSVVAALKKNSDIAVGNVVGSNIFNVLLVLGASAVLAPAGKPLGYDAASNFDIYFLLASSALLFLFLFTGSKGAVVNGAKTYVVDKWQSGVLLVGVLGYIVYLLMNAA
jgi:cation:H+ antiporter